MKSFLTTLTTISLSLGTISSLISNTNEIKSLEQQQIDKSYQYNWEKNGEESSILLTWKERTTEEQYANFFVTHINLQNETNNQLININQITDIAIKSNTYVWDSYFEWQGEIFKANKENTIDKLMKASSLDKKMSGTVGNFNDKELYKGAQYQILELNTKNWEGKPFKAGIKFGLKVYYNESNQLTATAWGILFYQISEIGSYLEILNTALLSFGQTLQFDYKY